MSRDPSLPFQGLIFPLPSFLGKNPLLVSALVIKLFPIALEVADSTTEAVGLAVRLAGCDDPLETRVAVTPRLRFTLFLVLNLSSVRSDDLCT